MRAWILDESPGSYREGEIADPAVGPGDVAVRPVASALNHMDLWLTRGLPRPHLPHVPGCDVAGVVEAVSDGVAGVAVGDEVVVNPAVSPVEAIVAHGIDSPLGAGFQILGEQRWGGHADRVVVPARNVLPRPARPTREEGAAMVGMGGGVSTAALALALRLGATVYTTSRDEAKRRRAVSLGAVDAFDSEADWPVPAALAVEG